jgi:hypothetical protein
MYGDGKWKNPSIMEGYYVVSSMPSFYVLIFVRIS